MPPRSNPKPPARLRVAAVQMKFAPTVAGNLVSIERALKRAARRSVDAVLFPECATTGYSCDFRALNRAELGAALARVGEWAKQYRINVLIGSPFFAGKSLFNGLVVFDRSGRQTYRYAKCHLTAADRQWFTPGNALALFEVEGVPATAIICHERRYPELVRLPVVAGARLIFHPNAGLDSLAVSRRKRGGKDGIVARAFENAVPYVFANSVGPQGLGRWSAGDSKIVAADGRMLCLADNENEALIVADLDLSEATGKYAVEALASPRFLAASWRRMVTLVRRQAMQAAK